MEKKESSDNLLPFFIKIENALCKERQRCREREKRKRKQQTQVAFQSNNIDRRSSHRELDDHNLLDIFNEWLLATADFWNQLTHSIGTFVLEPVNICSWFLLLIFFRNPSWTNPEVKGGWNNIISTLFQSPVSSGNVPFMKKSNQ